LTLFCVALDNGACSWLDMYAVHVHTLYCMFTTFHSRGSLSEQRKDRRNKPDALLQVLFEVEQRIPHLSRHYQLRIKKWILCLTQPISNNTWKRSRNQYCQLLLYQLVDKGRLTEPFNSEPKTGPLQNLPANALAEWRLSQRSTSRWRGQAGCAL
jgi:Domain of unknown function (DUF4485)